MLRSEFLQDRRSERPEQDSCGPMMLAGEAVDVLISTAEMSSGFATTTEAVSTTP